MKAILDAGPLIAAWDKSDAHHEWAKDLLKKHPGPYLTTEFVLSEVAHMTGKDAEIIEGVRTGRFIFDGSLKSDAAAIQRVLLAYDQSDIADASIVVLSEKEKNLPVLTTDKRHFPAYRRMDKSPLPLVTPG
jgi:predicted nucleic acid-binding protein